MAEILNINYKTFSRRIKDVTIDQENKGDKECEFCLRMKKNDILPSPNITAPAITNEMKEYIKNACNRHKTSEMAHVLGVKPDTLRHYILRYKSVLFTNIDPKKCHFCIPVNHSNWTTWNNMQPTIDTIKRLAIQENKTDESMICKIAVSMLYHTNRKASQIFQKKMVKIQSTLHQTSNINYP